MHELLDEVLTAHGGVERWQSVSAITARGRLSGLLPQRFAGNKLAKFTVEVKSPINTLSSMTFRMSASALCSTRASCGSKLVTANSWTAEPTRVRSSSG
ncbi:hypothetical protein GCM10020255_030190 [Rhodococcus baikonurensis]